MEKVLRQVSGMDTKAPHLIRAWLQAEGRKVLWLADQVQVDRSTASQWLSGNRIPLPSHRARLASVTGLDIAGAEAW